MRVLVDTSVWADFFNEQSTPESVLLARLIEDEAELVTCGLVVAARSATPDPSSTPPYVTAGKVFQAAGGALPPTVKRYA